MKTSILYLFLFIPLFLFAQKDGGKPLDILYMKNKDIYKGEIIKNEMGLVTIQIEENGKNRERTFQRFEIEKIEQANPQVVEGSSIPISADNRSIDADTKPSEASTEQKRVNAERVIDNKTDQSFTHGQVALQRGRSSTDIIEDPFSPIPYTPRRVRMWTRQIRGFRGFTDVALNLGVGKYGNNNLQFSQSIGFQFNPIVYLGVGVAYKYSFNSEATLPVFINPRLNFTDRNDWNPFWDVKAGFSPVEGKGAFVGTILGVGFVMGRRRQFSFNTGLSYTFQKAKFKRRNEETGKYDSLREDYHQIGIVTSFEF